MESCASAEWNLSVLLNIAREMGASDLHLCAGSPPIARIHGEVAEMPSAGSPPGEISCEKMEILIRDLLPREEHRRFTEDLDLDLSHRADGIGRFRVNLFHQVRGPAAVFRLIPDEIATLDELGLPAAVGDLVRHHNGLVLVTGPTGSGKSTTLAAMVDLINTCRRAHIITVEDPIEFVHSSKKALVNQREVGTHTRSFSSALRSALREDPDVILVGEMRDLETISLALTAAETGHLVLGTLHTTSAIQTVDRIVDVFSADRQEQVRTTLSSSLRGVVSQALLRRCDRPGRVAAVEVLIANNAVRSLIRDGKSFQIASVIQTGRQFGMQSLAQELHRLVAEGITTLEEAAQFTDQPDQLVSGGRSLDSVSFQVRKGVAGRAGARATAARDANG